MYLVSVLCIVLQSYDKNINWNFDSNTQRTLGVKPITMKHCESPLLEDLNTGLEKAHVFKQEVRAIINIIDVAHTIELKGIGI